MIGMIVCFGLIGISWILLGMWTYRDATNKGLNAKLWTLITLLGPSGIGLLIYFLVARKQSFIKCEYCLNSIPSDSKYCNKCGNTITGIKMAEVRSTKKLIIGFAVTFILAIGIFLVGLANSEHIKFKGGSSIFLVEVSTKNKWNISYYKSTAEFSRVIGKKESRPSVLYIDASCDEGQLYLKLTQNDIEEIIDISHTEGYMSIDLSNFEEQEIELELVDEKCKGVGLEAYWE